MGTQDSVTAVRQLSVLAETVAAVLTAPGVTERRRHVLRGHFDAVLADSLVAACREDEADSFADGVFADLVAIGRVQFGVTA